MKHAARDLTQGRLAGQIMVFSLPLMFSNLLQVLFNMSDVAVVGRFAGAAALGAVGSTTTMVSLFTSFLIGLGSGVNVLTARYFGARQGRELEQVVHTGALLCLALGLVILALGQSFARPLLELLGTKPELIEGAALYLRLYFLGMPALALYNFGNGVLSAVGDTRRPLIYLSIAGVLNVALNLFFVIVCGMDVDGVAIASFISQYVSAVLILRALFRSREGYGLRWSALRPDWRTARQLTGIGIPSGFQHAIFAVANLFIQAGVNSLDTVVVEANSAAANADSVVYTVMDAFYTACASFIGQNYGAGKRDRMKRSYFLALAYSSGTGLLLGLGLVVFGRQFLSLFTTESAVIEAGMSRLTIMGFSFWLAPFMDNTTAACRGLGKSLVPTVIVILGSCVFRVIWIYTVFAHFGTITSLYLLYIFSWAITAAAEIVYFIRCFRRLPEMQPID